MRASICISLLAASVVAITPLAVDAQASSGTAATTAFDGTYIGMPTADPQNKVPPCGQPQSQVLDVKGGAAKLRSAIDTRSGQVQEDGRLLMTGEQIYGSSHIKGLVDGRFSGNGFEGTSRFSETGCVFHWVLVKTQ